ncbi:putative prolyl-trna synthetase protein [Botrytis fragariae]|uniref:proline--tRNA ligase n=1 Tax=Botrytis fragariae TaxID=1964551 RepID=A0A8H6AHE2_9HELO|nr:putative prolyl-trna synthetase protein [Botrytis fragariae]KAF5867742.1 putative prolyl-trna synthetase protein [Botrytis fragariae]
MHSLRSISRFGGSATNTWGLCRRATSLSRPFRLSYSQMQPSLSTINDDRARLSKFWIPTGGIAASADEDSHAKLIRGGFLRQAHTGIFHMLPLGRRVQNKLEALIDKHMSTLGASKLALSSLSSEELWAKSGRLNSSSELFRLEDRKEARYLLAPTHEEEITELVSNSVQSYKELPVRLYQITRKYRDELRPRQGLLRSREFVMKDLYTFDYNNSCALSTYEDVRKAYHKLFDELKIPYLVAEADSGDIGGDLSHEFHFPTKIGEDNIISCSKCDYVANEELAESGLSKLNETESSKNEFKNLKKVGGFSRDGSTLIVTWFYSENGEGYDLNTSSIKRLVPDYDPSRKIGHVVMSRLINEDFILTNTCLNEADEIHITHVINLIDGRVPPEFSEAISREREVHFDSSLNKYKNSSFVQDPSTGEPLNLKRIMEGDVCPKCQEPTLKVEKAIELGHTFHLGTRYSKPMEATVTVPSGLVGKNLEAEDNEPQQGGNDQIRVPMEMGCHGIGVTRMIGAVAETLADGKGLNWPRVMAPFEIVVVPGKGLNEDALQISDTLSAAAMDPVVDDREVSIGWKMKDADLIGYPVIVLLGRKWKEGLCEVQCRRLDVKEDVRVEDLKNFVGKLLNQL